MIYACIATVFIIIVALYYLWNDYEIHKRVKIAKILLYLRESPEGLSAAEVTCRFFPLFTVTEAHRIMRDLERRGDVVSSECWTPGQKHPVVIYKLSERYR